MSKSAGGAGRKGRGGVVAALSPKEQLAVRAELGRKSDQISALNARTEKAQTAFERSIGRTLTSDKQREALLTKWRTAKAELDKAYKESLAFSKRNNIVKLPSPTGLEQRGSR